MNEIITLKNVSKSINNQEVLKKINLKVYEKDIFGLLGPNGAGKTTLFRCLTNLYNIDDGEVIINGELYSERKKVICYVSESERLYNELKLIDNLEFFDRLYNSKKNRKERLNTIMEMLDIQKHCNKYVFTFSKGMKRRLSMAIALIADSNLLILDEPLSGIDPEGKAHLKDIIKKIAKESTIIYSSHSLEDVENLSNRIAILNKKIILTDSLASLKKTKNNVVTLYVENISLFHPDLLNKMGKSIIDTKVNDHSIIIEYSNVELNEILKVFIDNNIIFNAVKTNEHTLNDIYLQIIKEKDNE